MNSSLAFQKLLFYHGTFNLIYSIMMILGQISRLIIHKVDTVEVITMILLILWMPLEFFRLRFGYRGNINETFPELIAFIIFTLFFIVPLSVVPLLQDYSLPHERCLVFLNISFVICEFFFGANLIRSFMNN